MVDLVYLTVTLLLFLAGYLSVDGLDRLRG